jgi:glycyl-tRNA synthetase
MIANETVGYFMGRTYLFLLRVGIKRERLRFRQHLKNEMAHYATDCWDAEIQNSYGWVESVGVADRACYDLQQHANETNQPQLAFVEFPDGPREMEVTSMKINREYIGKTIGKDSKPYIAYLEKLAEDDVAKLDQQLQKG